MLYLSNVLLRYVLIYNQETVSFNFHLTLLQLNVIKMFRCAVKTFFPFFRLFSSRSRLLELPITRTFFNFP